MNEYTEIKLKLRGDWEAMQGGFIGGGDLFSTVSPPPSKGKPCKQVLADAKGVLTPVSVHARTLNPPSKKF